MKPFWIALLFCLPFTQAAAQSSLGDLSSWQSLPAGVQLQTEGPSVCIRWLREDALRIDWLLPDQQFADSSLLLARWPASSWDVEVSAIVGGLLVQGGRIEIEVAASPLRLRMRDTWTGRELAEAADGGFRWTADWQESRWELSVDTRCFGTGERGTGPNLRGQELAYHNTQLGGYDYPPAVMNICTPTLLTTAGWSLLFDNAEIGVWDLGASQSDLLSFMCYTGGLSLCLCAGETLAEQLAAQQWVVGGADSPPRWAFGYLQSKYGYRNEAAARAVVETFDTHDLPLAALILDLYWFDQMGDLNWKLTDWPDPAGMMADFLDAGVRTVLITEPYVTAHSQHFTPLTVNHPDWCARDTQGNPWLLPDFWSCGCDAALVDMTHPEAGAWWWSLHEDRLSEGVAGFWTDLGEPERHAWGMQHYAGSGREVHNAYNLYWTQALFEGHQQFNPAERLFVLSRSGTTGSQRYGICTWSGDVSRTWGGLAAQVPLMLSMSLSGFPYHSSDLGGFTGYSTDELYIRWMQLGTFSPTMRAHGVDNQDTEPYTYGDEALAIAGDLIRLRHRLIPYLSSLAADCRDTGLPLARPLCFADPLDENLYSQADAFLLGDRLLVAPVLTAGVTQRQLYLPTGSWRNWWTGERYNGPGWVTLDTPLDEIPLLLRAGEFLPLQPVFQDAALLPDTLCLRAWPEPGHSGSLELLEDDGHSLRWQQGEVARTECSLSLAADAGNPGLLEALLQATSGSCEGLPTQREWCLELADCLIAPTSVSLNDTLLPQAESTEQFAELPRCWYYNSTQQELHIRLSKAGSQSVLLRVEDFLSSVALPAVGARPKDFAMRVYPNPANPTTNLEFELTQGGELRATLYNLQGQLVSTLYDGSMSAGRHQLRVRSQGLASGIYVIQLETAAHSDCRKFLLLR